MIDMPEEDRDGGRVRRKNCPTPVEGNLFMNTRCALLSSVMFVIIEVNHEIVIVSWGISAAFPLTHSSALNSRSGTAAHSAEAITRDVEPIR